EFARDVVPLSLRSGVNTPLNVRVTEGLTIRGRVLDSAGAPAPGVRVTVMDVECEDVAATVRPVEQEPWLSSLGCMTSWTDCSGLFVLHHVSPIRGTTRIQAFLPNTKIVSDSLLVPNQDTSFELVIH